MGKAQHSIGSPSRASQQRRTPPVAAVMAGDAAGLARAPAAGPRVWFCVPGPSR